MQCDSVVTLNDAIDRFLRPGGTFDGISAFDPKDRAGGRGRLIRIGGVQFSADFRPGWRSHHGFGSNHAGRFGVFGEIQLRAR